MFERALAAYWSRAGWSYDPSHPRFAETLFAVREFAITYHVPISRADTVRVQQPREAKWHEYRVLPARAGTTPARC